VSVSVDSETLLLLEWPTGGGKDPSCSLMSDSRTASWRAESESAAASSAFIASSSAGPLWKHNVNNSTMRDQLSFFKAIQYFAASLRIYKINWLGPVRKEEFEMTDR
jgi:hypothetical protein